MIRRFLTASICAACVLTVFTLLSAPGSAAVVTVEPGRFVWYDLMTKDVDAAKRFYGALLGWRFEDTKRGDKPYVIARIASDPVAGLVDVSSMPDAGPQWLSFMAVANVDQTVGMVKSGGGKVLIEPREIASIARAAIVTDPQGAPLGLAQLHRDIRGVVDPEHAVLSRFFWQEYLAEDAAKALAFYTRLAGYTSTITDTRLGVEYHVLRTATRPRAGLFQLPESSDVLPSWLPYVLVDDPDALAAKVPGLGGKIVVPAAQERRNGSLAVIADPGGALLALQKYPF
jgi:uncharacterized protein